MRWKTSRVRGYNLIELVSILILLGIVGVVVLSRLDVSPFRTAAFDQQLRSAIRFAHKFAIVSGCEVQVDVDDTAESYALMLRGDVTTPSSCLTASGGFGTLLSSPGGGTAAGTAPGNVDISAGLTFVYDHMGSPSTGGTIVVDGRTITIEPVTGYVY